MRWIARAFKYFVYFMQADTVELRKEASDASRLYYSTKPHLRNIDNVSSYKRGYRNARCHQIATEKLNNLNLQ
jgi:hypothetical protein